MKKTTIIIDTKLIAYTASLHRHKPITATMESMDSIVTYLATNYIEGTYEVIAAFDYEKSRYRQELTTRYKGHREHQKANKSPEEQAEYDKFQQEYRDILPHLMAALNIRVVGVSGVECDDLASIIANKFTNNIIFVTEDLDWDQSALLYPDKVSIFRPKSYKMVYAHTIAHTHSLYDKEEFLVRKAILGDTSDGILGVVQCGKVCYEKWMAPLRGMEYSREEWRKLFIALAISDKKFSVHKDYGDLSFGELFDLNIALGETMVDLSKLNEEETLEFLQCWEEPLKDDPQKLQELYTTHFSHITNDFGDSIAPPEFLGLRNVL